MADFNGTRDSSVAISTDNAGRKVLILDTITQADSLVGNIDSAEGNFDLGGTDQTSNPTYYNKNIESKFSEKMMLHNFHKMEFLKFFKNYVLKHIENIIIT